MFIRSIGEISIPEKKKKSIYIAIVIGIKRNMLAMKNAKLGVENTQKPVNMNMDLADFGKQDLPIEDLEASNIASALSLS